MANPLTRDGVIYSPIERNSLAPPELLLHACWAQKTRWTKIYSAYANEIVSQRNGERKNDILTKEGDVVFDNGWIPARRNNRGKVTEWRHDIYIPSSSEGKLTGATIRNNHYQPIGKGYGLAEVPMYGGSDLVGRNYKYYLPLPNPQAVVILPTAHYIPNAFGPNEHQLLEQPIIRLSHDGNIWRVSGG